MSILNRANTLFKEGKYTEAATLYQKVISSQPFMAPYIEENLRISLKRSGGASASLRGLSFKRDEVSRQGSISSKWAPSALDIKYRQGRIDSDCSLLHNELVSVIIPSYNNGKYLPRAINAALSQIGVRVEVIVVDDGSTDDSVNVALALAKENKNVQVHSLLRNFGCYYARNFAVQNSTGEYVALIDSDDIVAPNFLVTCLDFLKENPDAKACRSLQRRWSVDYVDPLSDLKPGESSLVWLRNLQEDIGWYDCVRFGGDTEFRFRIQRATGKNIPIIHDELYFARTLKTSLTLGSVSAVFKTEAGQLKANPNEARLKYFEGFTLWQKKNKPAGKNNNERNLYVGFPLFERHFPLFETGQNASTSLGQKTFGAIASFPPRKESLEKTISSVLPQLDRICVYLNNYEAVPDFLKHPKIQVVRSQEALGDLRDNGKFYAIPSDKGHYIFTLDDDIIYPADYVARMIHNIEMLGRQVVVGLHGVIFPEEDFSKLQQRKVFHFAAKSNGRFVDLLGTGTAAWHSSTLQISIEDFSTKGVCDLWFAKAAANRNVPLFSIRREKDWLRVAARHEENLYAEALRNSDYYFNIYNSQLKGALRCGRLRKEFEGHLSRGFDEKSLSAAGIEVSGDPFVTRKLPAPLYKQTSIIETEKGVSEAGSLHFHLIVNGWNCREYVDECLRSIAAQRPASYTYEVTLIDDGSTDGTFEKLATSTILPSAKLIRINENTGPAHARHVGVCSIIDPETIVVTLDMDDALEANALEIVAEKYRSNPSCLMTIGNWHDQHGKINPQGFYTRDEIDGQRVRSIEVFNATQLRTFRRKLYDAVTKEDLLDPYGKWLETCTDVALMYPLLDQCWASEVEFIKEPIYRYTRKHSAGTLARFGKPHKVERLAWLRSKEVKPRLNPKV